METLKPFDEGEEPDPVGIEKARLVIPPVLSLDCWMEQINVQAQNQDQ
jgi:hypothetical protein